MSWKKTKALIGLLLVLAFVGRVEAVPIAQAEERLGNYTGPSSGTAQDDNVKASLDLLHSKVGGSVDNIGTGNVFYVDSNVASEGAGTSWIGAKDTLDEAVDLCTDNNGDVIYVAQGHNENWNSTDSANLDVIGITVIGLGTGTNRPRFDYDTADAELVIGAANVKIYNLTFQPGLTAVVHAIEVEADADGSIIDSCEFLSGESETDDEFIDAIQLATAADDMIISNNVATEVTAGANTWLDASTGIVDNLVVIGNRVWGIYAEGGLYSNKACTQCYIADNEVTNLSTGIAAITFSGNATGTLVNNYASSDTPGTIIDPGYMQQTGNVETDEGANEDADQAPAWFGAAAGTGAYPINVEDDSLIAKILTMDNTGVATIADFSNATMSLEALNVDLDAILADTGTDGVVLAADAITAAKIAADAITNAEIANDAIGATEIADAAIDAATFAAGAIAAAGIADNALDAATFAVAIKPPQVVLKANADLTGYDDAVWFTVTGDVLVRIVGVVGSTGITSSSGTTAFTLGTTEDPDAIIASTVVDNGDFAATDVWVDNNPEDDAQVMTATEWIVLGGGADITLFRDVDDIAAGTLTLYCYWVPLSTDGAVVAGP
ncbi:MAG TPA: hypothetical protein VMY37_37935 [Thermoguttaceae bacterium]|nr:hypothetical protein [Thermoguttaceae bacterium]